jgi:hypothetical protein
MPGMDDYFKHIMSEREDRAEAFRNSEFRQALVGMYLAVNEMADRKGFRLEEMEILGAHMNESLTKIQFKAMPKGEAIKNISPILSPTGENIRRDALA